MKIRTRADDLKLESDEGGWQLSVETCDGDTINIQLPQDVAIVLADQAKRINDWLVEGHVFASLHVPEDDGGGYDPSDPKHPHFADGYAELD